MFEKVSTYSRLALLVVLVVASISIVFGAAPVGPTATDAGATVQEASSATTLRFGLDLAGGTRIQAPLNGVTATGVDIGTQDARSVEQRLAESLSDTSATDVIVRPPTEAGESASVEVTTANATTTQLKRALDASSIPYDSVRPGVTGETRAEVVRVLEDKVNRAGLGGGTVRTVRSADGTNFVLVEVPDQSLTDVRSLINDRGVVQVDVYYPTADGYQTKSAVLESDDFARIGTTSNTELLGPHVPVVLTSDAATRYAETARETGLTEGTMCRYETQPQQTDACLLTRVDGEVVYSAGMSPDLGQSIESGNWEANPSFVLQTQNMSEAKSLALHLRAGSLPVGLDLANGTSTYVSPSQGDHFKMSGLLIGLLSLFAVAGKVFYKYRDVRVAAPMVAVAASEVVILLGVAALLQYPIDLPVIGGLIAVIGTGVDDLIIIANEVQANGEVNSSRVFQSRFKKAFWVIGAAALTTIIALSPLVAMSLGALRGFAIFTIIGIIIGVAITRPAYGDVLEHLLLKDSR